MTERFEFDRSIGKTARGAAETLGCERKEFTCDRGIGIRQIMNIKIGLRQKALKPGEVAPDILSSGRRTPDMAM